MGKVDSGDVSTSFQNHGGINCLLTTSCGNTAYVYYSEAFHP